MARLWSCGFEMQSNADFMEVQDLTPNLGATISTSVKRAPGTASVRINPASGANCLVEHQLTTGVVMRTFHRFYIRVAALPAANSNIYHIGQSGYFPGNVQLRTDGKLILRDSNASVDLGSATSFALTLNRWYRIECEFNDVAGTITAGLSAFKMYVDGVLVSDQMCSNINGFSRVRMGTTSTSGGLDMYIDDVAVNDDSGTVQNGLPGPGCIVHMLPNAAGDNNLFSTAVGGTAGIANNYTRVNERTPNDSTSYNQTNASGTTTIDDFNLDSIASVGIGTADQINVVSVGSRMGSDNTTAATLVTRIKSQAAGTVLESASTTVNVNGWQTHKSIVPRIYQLTSYTDPQSGGAWTPTLLDSAQIGYRSNTSQTTARRVTALWALVDFVPRYALGVASVGSTATSLGYAKGNALVSTLVDDFDDNAISATKWPNSFGTRSETGGRARVSVDTALNGYSSARGYTLTESGLIVQVFPPTMGDGASESWAQVLIKSSTAGTELGFMFRLSDGALIPTKRSGGVDNEAPEYAYSPTSHRWVRIRETGGSVYFDAGPDGHAWTNLRTVTTPSYADDGDLEVQLSGHRADGTNNFVEFDNLNVLGPQSWSLGLAASGSTSRGLSLAHRTSVAGALSSSTGRPVLGRKTSTGGSPARIGEHATPAVARKVKQLGRPAQGEHATALRAVRFIALGVAQPTDNTANPVTWSKKLTFGAARLADQGRALTPRKTGAINATSSGNSGLGLVARKSTVTGLASSSSSAKAVVRAKRGNLAHSAESSHANPVTVRKTTSIGHAAENGTTEGLRATRWHLVAPAPSQAAGTPVLARKSRSLAPTGAQETAHPVSYAVGSHVTHASIVEGSRPITASKRLALTGDVSINEQGRPVTWRRAFNYGMTHTDDGAQPVKPIKTAKVGPGEVNNLAAAVTPRKLRTVGRPNEVDTARPLTYRKLRTLGAAADRVSATGVTHRLTSHLGAARSQDAAGSTLFDRSKSIGRAHLAEEARGVAASKRLTLGRSNIAAATLALRPTKLMPLGAAHEGGVAGPFSQPERTRLLVHVHEADTARPVRVVRQRPGVLKPSTTGPGLTPGTAGPKLIATSKTTGGS